MTLPTQRARFTYDWYREFLSACGESRTLTTVSGAASGVDHPLILRHDVDYDLECAVDLAEVEREVGVRSSYFVLISTDFYNPLSRRNRDLVRKLSADGFEVGLHFDPCVHGDLDRRGLQAAFDGERSALAAVIGGEVLSASLHNPSSLSEYVLFDGIENAYDTRWFGPDRYLSDSRRQWRHDPIEFVRSAPAEMPLQILLHPIHFGVTERGYREVFRSIRERNFKRDEEYIASCNSTYRNELLLESGSGRCLRVRDEG